MPYSMNDAILFVQLYFVGNGQDVPVRVKSNSSTHPVNKSAMSVLIQNSLLVATTYAGGDARVPMADKMPSTPQSKNYCSFPFSTIP